jgi:hypothetical protein
VQHTSAHRVNMCVCASMIVFVHVCCCVCTRVFVYSVCVVASVRLPVVSVCVNMHGCVYVCLCMCDYVRTCLYVCVSLFAFALACVLVCLCMRSRVFTLFDFPWQRPLGSQSPRCDWVLVSILGHVTPHRMLCNWGRRLGRFRSVENDLLERSAPQVAGGYMNQVWYTPSRNQTRRAAEDSWTKRSWKRKAQCGDGRI